jgi:hypothetical protein
MHKQESPYKIDWLNWAKPLSWMKDYIPKLLNLPDLKDAAKMVGEQARHVWQKYLGPALERIQLEITALEEDIAKSDARLSALIAKLKATKRYVCSELLNGDGANQYIPFPHWRVRDKVVFIVALVAAVVVLMMGAGNVYANIMGSGNAVFLEAPYLAALLSALLPAGSIALEFVADTIKSTEGKALYIKTIHGLTVLVLLGWTALFAWTFHGVSVRFTLDDLEGSNTAAIALTWVQLLAEMLVGVVLFQVAADISSKYAPNKCTPNPDYIEIQQAIKEEEVLNKRLREERNEKRGIKVALEASLQAFVNDMIALYRNMKKQLDDSSPL